MNETIIVMSNRVSCRNFKDKNIEDSILDEVLKVGLSAPTGGDLQPFQLLKLRTR